MSSPHPRQALVLLLILATGVAGVTLRLEARREPPIPAVTRVIGNDRWEVSAGYEPSRLPYRQWRLRDQAGAQALLYLEATGRALIAQQWSGELGYVGAGYAISDPAERVIDLANDGGAAVDTVTVRHLSDTRVVEYAVVSRDGVLTHHANSPLRAAWEALRGGSGPYYLVRVSVPFSDARADAESVATSLMSSVLPHLLAEARRS